MNFSTKHLGLGQRKFVVSRSTKKLQSSTNVLFSPCKMTNTLQENVNRSLTYIVKFN